MRSFSILLPVLFVVIGLPFTLFGMYLSAIAMPDLHIIQRFLLVTVFLALFAMTGFYLKRCIAEYNDLKKMQR